MRGYVLREQLYEEVWSVPLTTLCEKYGLSDNGLRKACLRMNVPVPPRGYWAKVEAGHKVSRPPLPKEAQRAYMQIRDRPAPVHTEAEDADAVWLKERKAVEQDPANAIVVTLKPRRWHAAVAPLHEFFEQEVKEVEASRRAEEQYQKWPEWRKQREYGPDRMKWQWVERNGQLMPATHRAFAVRLSFGTYKRGLAILNGLAFAAEKRGFEVTYSDKKGRLVVVGHGGTLELRMSEATEQKTRKVKRYDGKMEDERYRVPTGRLRLAIERGYGQVKEIAESEAAPLESRLNEVMVAVYGQVVRCRAKARHEEERERCEAVLAAERAEAERVRREEERKVEAERKRRVDLVAEAEAWRQAALIRAYVAAVQREAESRGDEAVAKVAEWGEWALQVAQEMEPIESRISAGE